MSKPAVGRTLLAVPLRVAGLVLLAVCGLAMGTARATAGDEDEERFPRVAGLQLTDMVLARDVEDGQVVGPSTAFSQDEGAIYLMLRIRNLEREATKVRVSFEPIESLPRPGIALDVPARHRWRTVARTTSRRPAGRYRAVVRTEQGELLGDVEFVVTE